MRRLLPIAAAVLLIAAILPPAVGAARADRDDKESKDPFSSSTFSGLSFRSLGPAMTSGRVGDFAVRPDRPQEYYVAVASGGVWKTVNGGTTWEPIFDGEGSYSIGCVTLDPRNPLVVWVGTGENNSQRSVSYGDGVYRSVDGGKTWRNMGLKESEHVGMIVVDPRDSRVVWVAAQGPLWGPGGDRGLYKSTDGGETWQPSLQISENTGVSEVWLDPRDPDVMYASAYQRRRHVWTLIDGGPESAIYKSTDGGDSWQKLSNGLPKGDVGRIGLAVAPSRPDVVYAIIEATGDETGFYRSTDAGATWKKMSGYVSSSPQYYQELFVDPHDADRVYSMDTFLRVTEDGGAKWERVPIEYKHVDDHAMWIDPDFTDHLLVGCDGGIYETWDRGGTWDFKANLPVTQFYRICADTDFPFYHVYGGTQDNNTLGAPARTNKEEGIANSDWYITQGGDGFQPQVDPDDPDIVYSQYQYGGLARYDRRSGEGIDIQPVPGPDVPPQRWNWNSPLIISPHSATRLYFASQMIWRSDDRGDSWTRVSGDLTRHLDRNRLEVMGTVWSVDTVAKNRSTSFYGNVVYLSESPLVEGLIYAGTDDGLVQVTEDGGESWRRIEKFKGVPEMTYVSCLTASRHDPDVVYATFDNHKMADFEPYVLRSDDRGRSWRSIKGDLPERGQVHSLVEDGEKADLLFAGTEFGVFFTVDGGERWVQLKGGLPIIACRDLALQRRENDLVVGTFGRGIYVLDDYTPLRQLDPQVLRDSEAILFPTRDAWMYHPAAPLGGGKKGSQGAGYYQADNPPFGAVLTYYLRDELKTLAEKRHELEKKTRETGKPVYYPPWDDLRAEDREREPRIILTVSDVDGNVVRRLTGSIKAGIHRLPWDLRYPAPDPVVAGEHEEVAPWDREPTGPMVAPGTYSVSLAKRVRGETTELAGPQEFEAVPLGLATLPAADREAAVLFQRKVADLQRAVRGALRTIGEADKRLDSLRQALLSTPAATQPLRDEVEALDGRLEDIRTALSGDRTVSRRSEPIPPAIAERVGQIVYGLWGSSSAPTQTQRDSYDVAADQFAEALADLRKLVGTDLVDLEACAEAAGAPWTPGRLPDWSR